MQDIIKMRARANAVRKWQAVPIHQNLDDMYEQWSDIWEEFLYERNGERRAGPSRRGKDAKKRELHRAPLQTIQSLPMRKLANYINVVRILLTQIDNDQVGTQRRWQQLARGAMPLAQRYGTPDFTGAQPSGPTAATRHILEVTRTYYQQIWSDESKRERAEARQTFRVQLAQHGGINRKVASLLKGESTAVPRVISDEGVVSEPEQVITMVQQAWRTYFDKCPEEVSPRWLEDNSREQRPVIDLPPLTGQFLSDVLKTKNKRTAAGRDSWHMGELAELPIEAFEGLAHILNSSETATRLPKGMTPAWMAIVPKSPKPSPPLSVRPISILSSVYRLYASARTSQLQDWARGAFHEWQKAYVRGRSPKEQLARLSHLMDDAILQNSELHVISMDASKAFPSVSRLQVKALLAREGYPPYLFDTVESLYQQGGVYLR